MTRTAFQGSGVLEEQSMAEVPERPNPLILKVQFWV